MKPDSDYIDKIRIAFAAMQTKEDLLATLNLAKQALYGKKAKDFALRNLTYYADQRNAPTRYTTFHIAKKRGGVRIIHAPVAGLKAILRCLNFVLLCAYNDGYEDNAMGFIHGKSIKDNAQRHSGKQYVYNIDLKDFFPSIDLHRVKAILMRSPFDLNHAREPLAFLLANLCCAEMEVNRSDENGEIIQMRKAVLPQGSPTSPAITNFIARKLDGRLKGAAKRFGATYTRYADDITFSSQHHLYGKNSEFIQEIGKIIAEQGFSINTSKVRLQRPWFRQEVTGLIVNKQPNVPRKYVKQVRQWIYLWETYGYEKSDLLFRRDYTATSKRIGAAIPPMLNVLEGKLRYMRMVVGKEHPTWQKLNERLAALTTDRTLKKIILPNLNEELENLFQMIDLDIQDFVRAKELDIKNALLNAAPDEQATG